MAWMDARVRGSRSRSRYTGSTARRSARTSAGVAASKRRLAPAAHVGRGLHLARGARSPCPSARRWPRRCGECGAGRPSGRRTPARRRTARARAARGSTLVVRCEPFTSRLVSVDPERLALEAVHPGRPGSRRRGSAAAWRRARAWSRRPRATACVPMVSAPEVARRGETARDAERPADGPRQDADPHEAERMQLVEHRIGDLARQHPLLEPIAVDQERRVERAEPLRAELVPRAGARERQVGPAVPHRADRGRLVGGAVVRAARRRGCAACRATAAPPRCRTPRPPPAAERVEERERPNVAAAGGRRPRGRSRRPDSRRAT